MKPSEIIPRQNRVIYVLMVVVAVLALLWATWEHGVSAGTPTRQPHLTKADTLGKSVITVRHQNK